MCTHEPTSGRGRTACKAFSRRVPPERSRSARKRRVSKRPRTESRRRRLLRDVQTSAAGTITRGGVATECDLLPLARCLRVTRRPAALPFSTAASPTACSAQDGAQSIPEWDPVDGQTVLGGGSDGQTKSSGAAADTHEIAFRTEFRTWPDLDVLLAVVAQVIVERIDAGSRPQSLGPGDIS